MSRLERAKAHIAAEEGEGTASEQYQTSMETYVDAMFGFLTDRGAIH